MKYLSHNIFTTCVKNMKKENMCQKLSLSSDIFYLLDYKYCLLILQ